MLEPELSQPRIVEESAPAVSLLASSAALLQPATRISKPDFAVEGPGSEMVLKIADAPADIEPDATDLSAREKSIPEIVGSELPQETTAVVELPVADAIGRAPEAASDAVDVDQETPATEMLSLDEPEPQAASAVPETTAASRAADAGNTAFSERFDGARRMLDLENFTHGLNRLTELANAGYAPAANLLADMAARGEGMDADAEQALTWRHRAAQLGSAEAQFQLAEMYMHGRTVEPDEATAINYYRDAAHGGHEHAREKLRSIYADAGLPVPDFSRPRKPIAIDPATNRDGSATDDREDAGSVAVEANAELGENLHSTERAATADSVGAAGSAAEKEFSSAPRSNPYPTLDTDTPAIVSALDEHASDHQATNFDRDVSRPSDAEPVQTNQVLPMPSGIRDELAMDTPATSTTDQLQSTPSTSDEASNVPIAATDSDGDSESPSDQLTELVVPELIGDESIVAFTDDAPTETSPEVAALRVPEASTPSIAVASTNVAPAVIEPPVAAAATVAATTALAASATTQPRKGFFGRLKGILSRDTATASSADSVGQAGAEAFSEPEFTPDVDVVATEPGINTENEVPVSAVDPSPVPSVHPSGAESDDVVEVDQATAAIGSPVEANLELPMPNTDHSETHVVVDTESKPSLLTIDDGKRALVDGRFADAIEIFTELAHAGHAEAQAHLGYMYYKGEGVEADLGLAVDWYERAAELGNRDAQYNLAVAYAFGEGVEHNDGQAVMRYRRAAEQGSAIGPIQPWRVLCFRRGCRA